ncbi:hypothetical protein HK102_008220, partial [Quaeritorhiza haematococci]
MSDQNQNKSQDRGINELLGAALKNDSSGAIGGLVSGLLGGGGTGGQQGQGGQAGNAQQLAIVNSLVDMAQAQGILPKGDTSLGKMIDQ